MIDDHDGSSDDDEEEDTDEDEYDEDDESSEEEAEGEEGSDDDCEVIDVQKINPDKDGVIEVDEVNEVILADNSTEKKIKPTKAAETNILAVAEDNGEEVSPGKIDSSKKTGSSQDIQEDEKENIKK